MSRLIVGFALTLIVAATAVAQDGGDQLFAHIDLPTREQVVTRPAFAVHGWAFNCSRGGQQPFSAKVSLYTATGPQEIAVTRHSGLKRPDVQAAYAGTCAEMSGYTGFALVPADWTTLPVGTFTLVVEWADSHGAVYSQRRVTLQ